MHCETRAEEGVEREIGELQIPSQFKGIYGDVA